MGCLPCPADPGAQPTGALHAHLPSLLQARGVWGIPQACFVTITLPTLLVPIGTSLPPRGHVLPARPPMMAVQRCQVHLCHSGTSGLLENRPCILLVWTHGYLGLSPCQGLRSPRPKGLTQARDLASTWLAGLKVGPAAPSVHTSWAKGPGRRPQGRLFARLAVPANRTAGGGWGAHRLAAEGQGPTGLQRPAGPPSRPARLSDGSTWGCWAALSVTGDGVADQQNRLAGGTIRADGVSTRDDRVPGPRWTHAPETLGWGPQGLSPGQNPKLSESGHC